jgi:hypothetical protein
VWLTQEGEGFTYGGWMSLHQRLRRRLEKAGFKGYKQHRDRNTWALNSLEAGVPTTAVVQMGGWKGPEMLNRYHGRIPTTMLKTMPQSLDVYGKAI